MVSGLMYELAERPTHSKSKASLEDTQSTKDFIIDKRANHRKSKSHQISSPKTFSSDLKASDSFYSSSNNKLDLPPM
jgi:hypothetical protein